MSCAVKYKTYALCLVIICCLAACGHRSDQLAAGVSAGANTSANAKNTIIVGSVTGGATALLHPERIHDDDFREALTKSLANNTLLAADDRSANYKIDAEIDQDYSGSMFGDKDVQEKITYKVYDLRDGSLAFQKIIVTHAIMEGLTAKGLLFESSQSVNQRWFATYSNAAKDNLKQFMDVLVAWLARKT